MKPGVLGKPMIFLMAGMPLVPGCERGHGPRDIGSWDSATIELEDSTVVESWDPYRYVPYPADRLAPPGCSGLDYHYPYAYGCRCTNERDCPPGYGCRCCIEAEWVCVCDKGEGTWFIWCCGRPADPQEGGCNGG